MSNIKRTTSEVVCEDDSRYNELNDIIKQGLGTFLEVGEALSEIREKKLYRVEFTTWDKYLEQKHGIQRQYASRLINAKSIMGELEEMLPTGDISILPQNESQMRPLSRLKSPEDRKKAWGEAVAAAAGHHPTQVLVAEKVSGLIPARREPVSEVTATVIAETVTIGETKTAILRDGSEVADALWVEGYIDAEVGQQYLDKIAKSPSMSEAEIVSLQRSCLAIFAELNNLHEKHTTKDMRNGMKLLFRETLHNLPIVAAKPGDMEPSPCESVDAEEEN